MSQSAQRPPRPSAPRSSVTPRRILRVVGILGGLFVVISAGLLAAVLVSTRGQKGGIVPRVEQALVPPELVFEGRQRVNVLLIGEDESLNNKQQVLKEWSRADTNIVIGLERGTPPQPSLAHVLSIPRDTKAIVPGQGVHKLNAAHKYGGPPLLIQTIQQNYGLQIDHYLKTNFHGFVVLVDMLGGIDVDVERDMNYDDTWQDFHVHLKKGFQHLNGQQAHGYVRWRKSKNGDFDPKGDLGRNERQQKVIKILARKALTPANLPKLPALMREARKYIETDLNDRQLLSLVLFLSQLDPTTLDTATLPSVYTGNFVEVKRDEATLTLSRMFGPLFDPTRLVGGIPGDKKGLKGAKDALPGAQPKAAVHSVSPDEQIAPDDADTEVPKPKKPASRPAAKSHPKPAPEPDVTDAEPPVETTRHDRPKHEAEPAPAPRSEPKPAPMPEPKDEGG